jgi:hypothetical protein
MENKGVFPFDKESTKVESIGDHTLNIECFYVMMKK